MRLKVGNYAHFHSDVVACLSWSSTNELYSLGDDQKLLRWSADGENLGVVTTPLFPTSTVTKNPNNVPIRMYYTSIHWAPGNYDGVAVGSTDGKLILCSRSGTRIDKVVTDAHRGAILTVSWSSDAGTILTAGEDGVIKIWSKTGMLRSALVTQNTPVFSAAWSFDATQILFTSNRSLSIKPLQAGSKINTWRAHDGLILSIAWNETTGLIVSGGEDKKYKVWDAFGRLLFSSQMLDHPITSVSWTPSGECFAIGSYNAIRVCDRLGWTLASSSIESGSILQLAWMPDGTSFAFSSANGNVGFAHLVDRKIEWRNVEVEVLDDKIASIRDAITGNEEQVDFKDKIIHVGIAFGTVLLITRDHAHVFTFGQSLHTFDLPNIGSYSTSTTTSTTTTGKISSRIICVRQCKSYFAVVDQLGVTIATYTGRIISTIKLPRCESLHDTTIAINDEVVAIRNPTNERQILTYDVTTGKSITTYVHTMSIRQLDVDHVGILKHLIIIDKNNDMYITQLSRTGPFIKLSGMTESARFSEDSPVLAANMENHLTFLMHPGNVFVDTDLRLLTRKVTKETIKGAHISWFAGLQCALRRTDGSNMIVAWTCPFTRLLHELAARKKWNSTITLCRAAKSTELWPVLAGLAIQDNELNTAEVAYAAIDSADKVQYLTYIRELKSNELRKAELLVFKRQFREAESMLLASGNPYLTIRMWIILHQWERALDVANRFKEYLPVVLAKRDEYLARIGMEEKNKRFRELVQTVTVDREQAKLMIESEERKVGLGSGGLAR